MWIHSSERWNSLRGKCVTTDIASTRIYRSRPTQNGLKYLESVPSPSGPDPAWIVDGAGIILLILISSSVLAQGFQTLDRVDGRLIERKLGEQQNPICRASVPGGGSWFSARVHLNAKDEMVTPQGLNPPNQQSLDRVKKALKRCRSSPLYL